MEDTSSTRPPLRGAAPSAAPGGAGPPLATHVIGSIKFERIQKQENSARVQFLDGNHRRLLSI